NIADSKDKLIWRNNPHWRYALKYGYLSLLHEVESSMMGKNPLETLFSSKIKNVYVAHAKRESPHPRHFIKNIFLRSQYLFALQI
ncbi:UNVERIFIED_CONTAM: hypothetical protein LJA28_08645, partial [Campylobacter jejuni]